MLDLDLRRVNYEEVQAREWMWNRKPRSFLGEGVLVTYSWFCSIALLLIPTLESFSLPLGAWQWLSRLLRYGSAARDGDVNTKQVWCASFAAAEEAK